MEIARQLRLRDIGGIIVIDYIDMVDEENRQRVTRRLEQALRDDPARTKVLGISELGLMQLTRKRTRNSLESLLTRVCPTCDGRGRVKRAETLAAEIASALRDRMAGGHVGGYRVRVAPDVVAAVRGDLRERIGLAGAVVQVEEAIELELDRFEIRDL